METAGSSFKYAESRSSSSSNKLATTDTKDQGGTWKCSYCNLEEHYNYKGSKPPFAKHLTFSEDCYIMKDPFSPANKSEILILGADCSICGNPVCVECSLFYTKRFCKACALKNMEYFPIKVQGKITVLNEKSTEV